MDRFKNKYRIASARAPFWDYAWNAAYFVTICTKNREHWFGKITDGVMDLSDIGEIVQSEWFKTFEMRPDMNLWMGEYVVMPNHFHAIIGIGENEYNTQRNTQRRDAMHCVSTLPPIPPIPPKSTTYRRIAMRLPKTNSAPNPKIWHPLFGGLKLG